MGGLAESHLVQLLQAPSEVKGDLDRKWALMKEVGEAPWNKDRSKMCCGEKQLLKERLKSGKKNLVREEREREKQRERWRERGRGRGRGRRRERSRERDPYEEERAAIYRYLGT